MRTWLTVAAVVLVMSVAVAPVQADFLASLHQGISYTFFFTPSADNTGPTGIVFLKVSRSGKISSATPFVLPQPTNTVLIEDTPGSNADALVILVSPSPDGTAAPGKVTLVVTNNQTGQTVAGPTTYTGDKQFYFQVVP